MARPIKIKINVTRILKDYLFEGKNGKYLDLVAWPNKNGAGQYGDTHFVVQDLPREARDKGEQGPILGNLTLPDDEQQQPRQKYQGDGRSERKPAPKEGPLDRSLDDDDDIPF